MVSMFQSSIATVRVSDLSRAIRFYVDQLGLTLKEHYGDRWAAVQAPGLTIGLHPAGAADPPAVPSGGMSIGFQVEQLEAVMATLQERGVSFAPVSKLKRYDIETLPLHLGVSTNGVPSVMPLTVGPSST